MALTTNPDATVIPGAIPSTRRRRSIRGRKSPLLTAVMALIFVYSVIPLVWLVINSTKSNQGLFSTPGLWVSPEFDLVKNIGDVLTYEDGIYVRWFMNTVLYSVVGAGGASLIAAIGGYGLAKYEFRGKKALFAIVLGAITIPGTVLAIPTFLLFSSIGLVNTPWAVIIPSLASPFGLYLMRVYADGAISDSLIEAARVDGAGELRIFFVIAMRLLAPGFVTVLLFQTVATWNNYFLPLIVLNDPEWFPLTVGLNQWNAQANGGMMPGDTIPLYPLVLTGSLLALVPLIAAFFLLQRYWQAGLTTGSVK